jgi:hypothetical protein
MKFIIYFVLFSALSTVGFSQTFTMNQGGANVKNYYVELPYESINGKMILSVGLKGKTHRFLFDTGAPTALNKELATQISADLMHTDIARDVNGHADSVSIVKLNDINLGNVTFSGIPSMCFLPDLYKCWNVDGVIGSNLLRSSIVSIVSAKHLIIIADQSDKLPLNKRHSVPLITNEGNNVQSNPVIKINLKNKVNLALQFDTGDNGFLRFTDDFMNQLAKYDVYETIAKGYGASQIGGGGLQANADKYLLKIPFLNIGSARFDNVITETNKGGTAGFGTKLLEYGNVTLDFINSKFYFDGYIETNDLNGKHWPFQPTVTDNKLVVGLVWDKAINLVKPGEQIVAINDEQFLQVNLCEMINRKPVLADKDSVTITIKNQQGAERKVKIIKE